MQPQNSVITEAVRGYGEKLAEIYGLSVGRFYQILEADFYNKTRRLIRALAAVDKSRVRLIKADLDALFTELLGEDKPKANAADVLRESSELALAILEEKPPSVIVAEARDVVLVGQQIISDLDTTKAEIREQNFGDLQN